MKRNKNANPSTNNTLDNLTEKEGRYKHLLQNSFDMIVLLDSSGVQRYVSESCEKIVGYHSEELLNIPVIDTMIHPDDQEKVRQGLMDILSNINNGGIDYRHRHKNGGWVYLEAFGTNQINNPNVNAVIINVRDVTERKHAELAMKENEVRLNELNATKDKFFSIIAHDLKSPFNSIVGFSNLLINQIREKNYEDVERYAEIIKQSSEQAMELLTNLLVWSQTQTGRIEFSPEYFDLHEVADKVVNLLSNTARQKAIHIDPHIRKNLRVFADKAMIDTILRNLISNAIKFTEKKGKITIQAGITDNSFSVTVIDTGVGIDADDVDKLFNMTDSFSTKGTHDESGTGLGLLLYKDFVDRHNGIIRVESEPGKGSTFCFIVPQ